MVSKYRLSHKTFELKSIKKSKYFELYRYFIPIKNINTGQDANFLIELFAINPTSSARQLQFSPVNENKIKTQRASHLLVRVGLISKDKKFIHVFYPGDSVRYDKKFKRLTLGTAVFSPEHISGSFVTTADVVEWEISFFDFNYHSYFLRQAFFPSIATPCKTNCFNSSFFPRYQGSIRIAEEEYEVGQARRFSFFDGRWGKNFSKPLYSLASHDFISLISGKRLAQNHFICTSYYNYKAKKYLNYIILLCNALVFKFYSKQMQVLMSKKNDFTQWTITAENRQYLIDIDIYCPNSDIAHIGYSFESTQKVHSSDQFAFGTTGYGELRIYKKIKKKLETLEHVRIENCFFEQAVNLPLS